MFDALTQACQQLMRDLLFPDCRVSTQSIPNVQRYDNLPEIIEPHALYVQGQLCTPAPSIDVWEGNALQIWDQSGLGVSSNQDSAYGSTPVPPPAPFPPDSTPSASPGGPPFPGSAAPSGTTGAFSPQWTVQPPGQYPGGDTWSQFTWPASTTGPWTCGQPPSWAWEGGSILINPAPNAGPIVINGEVQDNIVLRAVLPHPVVTDLQQPLWFPLSCARVLSWYMVAELLFADETQIAQARATQALQRYEREKNQTRTDIKVFKNSRSIDTPKVVTGRQWPSQNRQICRTGPF